MAFTTKAEQRTSFQQDSLETIPSPETILSPGITPERIPDETPGVIGGEKDYIIKETPIKKDIGGILRTFHVKRDRVLLTPSMCTHPGCGFDTAKVNGYEEGWDYVPEKFRKPLLKALEEHRNYAHGVDEEWVVKESQIPKQWLGEDRAIR